MKSMTCKQLGGACDNVFTAETFEEMAELSKDHGMEMFSQNDQEHMAAMQKIIELTKDPDAFVAWMEERKKEFDALANNEV